MPIEQVSPGLERILDLDQEVEWLASGFGGDGSALGVPWWPAEGPLWWQEDGYLLFSDIGQNRRMRYTDEDGLSVHQTDTNEANGLARDPQGRLLACEHAARRVTRQEADGSITVVADRYDGKRLNRPNDLVVKSDGTIYFTDPYRDTYPGMELGFAGVYRVSPDLSEIELLVDDYVGPNGLCFSPGESTLYVNDSRVGLIKAWDVRADGGIENGRLLCVLQDERPRRAGRDEVRPGGEHLRYRAGRGLDSCAGRPAPGHDRAGRRQTGHERGIWGRRLEDAVHHHV